VADSEMTGPVLATVHPHSISIHNSKPEGSPRNSWETTITRIEHYGSRVRVQTGAPLSLAVEITAASEEALSLAEGTTTWVALKATEIQLQPR
jgi:molybdate transport system ATP-binding protein